MWARAPDLSGKGISLNAETMLHPFAEKLNEKIDHIQIKGDGINPQAFIVGLPEAKLDFDATVVPAFAEGLALEGSIDLLNSAARPPMQAACRCAPCWANLP